MSIAVLVLLAVTAALGLVLTARGEQVRPSWGGAILAALLAVAAVVAWASDAPASGLLQGVTVAAVLAAVLGGGPVATAVLGAADPAAVGVAGGPQDPSILRGGAWIGVLERAAVAATLLAGSAEGLAVVLAVKGLGRFAELRAPAAAERFIVGTLASGIWAAGCVGVAVLLRG
jgi:hypothetical protein